MRSACEYFSVGRASHLSFRYKQKADQPDTSKTGQTPVPPEILRYSWIGNALVSCLAGSELSVEYR